MTITTFITEFQGLRHPRWDSDRPIREELFSAERLEQHAESLAAAQTVSPVTLISPSLTRRLRENAAFLLKAHQGLAKAVDQGRAITPAAEWLVDNYHIVEAQIREIETDLPPGYYRILPKLADGPFAGYPRVLGIAWAFVAHSDSHFDPATLLRFVNAYQRVQPLTIGELWAIAITLRFVLVENLRRSAARIILARAQRQDADGLADRLLGINGKTMESAAVVLAAYGDEKIPAALAVQLVQRLRDQDPKITPALDWLDQHLARWNTTSDAVVQEEHQRQGASNVTVRNIITSMRLVSDVDWSELVESVSLVDATFRTGSTFSEMDFATRNLYRNAVEELARRSSYAELDVARKAMAAAAKAQANVTGSAAPGSHRQCDPGYYLLSDGRRAFEAEIGFRPSLRLWLRRRGIAFGIHGYVASTCLLAVIFLALPLLVIGDSALSGWMLALLAYLGLIPALDLATALVNRDVTTGFGAVILPGLDLADGVPTTLKTIVVIPTLLTDKSTIDEQIERLEIHYLTAPKGEVYFALLSDWLDAKSDMMSGDDLLLQAALDGIARLNHRHPCKAGQRFFLLHRRRIWNSRDERWMGWERKRGKLHELNRLLRGATNTSFLPIADQSGALPADIRYVITLDADTKLPRETIRRLIGKMAHPMNRPTYDPVAGRVIEGYAVLQPRVTPSLPIGHEGSLFQRIVSSPGGIDPYAAATSDLYQDLFGEGSYTGKGIFDIDAFELALADRIPDNAVLSHDLFEGIFARAGLASDIEVVEEFPSRYDVAAARQHRWVRGDWQLLPWLLGHPQAQKLGARRALPAIGFWKIADNLRRTLVAPTTLVALLTGWFLPLHLDAVWFMFLLATLALPTLIPVLSGVFPRRLSVTLRSHFAGLATDVRLALAQLALQLIFLAHQTSLMADAIMRTLYRLLVSHQNLLEWTTAAQAATGPQLTILGFARRMSGGLAIAVVAAIIVSRFAPQAWPIAVPLILLWLSAPAIACWVSRTPPDAARIAITDSDARNLRRVARQTWRYFETFVTPADRMLPPDNFQEDPKPVLAHRTSPTNLGLYLLSAVSARDFGWIGLADTVDRLSATLATMAELERFRGHFYNWYDTQDLRPLDPRYISTVDSGNLAGHLITLANACLAWRRQSPATPADVIAGIADNLSLAQEALLVFCAAGKCDEVTSRSLSQKLADATASLQTDTTPDLNLRLLLAKLDATLAGSAEQIQLVSAKVGEPAADLLFWVTALQQGIVSHRRDQEQSADQSDTLADRLQSLEQAARRFADEMEFGYLLNRERGLLSIGYLVTDGSQDVSCYDLLASEARLASLFAIAKGDIPTRHWFRLGRTVTPVAASAALISWSGSMFEYLMPSLIMRAPSGSLLEQTNRLIVQRQMSYASRIHLPWGISESAYNVRDIHFTYQYSSFGVPGLGLKRGLGESAVVAPYATGLAAMVDPAAAMRNFDRLAELGGRGHYGFYEALDFTKKHLPENSRVAIVRAYMSHHQGMTIVAIANVLFAGLMRSRFHAEPIIQATDLLLQERTPKDVSREQPKADYVHTVSAHLDLGSGGLRRLRSPHDVIPATNILSNGRYAVMITAAGSGYSRWRDLAITRWREDVTRDDWGSYVFLRDLNDGKLWSAGYQPVASIPDKYRVSFSEDRVELIRRDGSLTTAMEVIVSAEDDAEVRRITISNSSSLPRDIEMTSYAELVLAPPSADSAHPAFSKLFVETSFLPEVGALVATRRRRSPTEPEIWAAQLMILDGAGSDTLQVETDRARFIGRGGTLRQPVALSGQPLSGTVGTTLDPIFAMRRQLRIPPRDAVHVALWTLVATSREKLLDLIDRHQDAHAFQRASTLAWTQAQVQLRHLNISPDEANVFQRLASHILYANGAFRPSPEAIIRGRAPQSALWAQGISGDTPIVLLRIDDTDHLDIVQQVLRAHEYWRTKQISVDLVILNERGASYIQDLQIALESAIRASQSRPTPGEAPGRGSVFLLRADLISVETRALLSAVARIVLVARRGSLPDQLARLQLPPHFQAAIRQSKSATMPSPAPAILPSSPSLAFANGLGGFAQDGKEYVTVLDGDRQTPAPWINVIANPHFGFQVSTTGSGYTWSVNSREHQLTPWSNDPVRDPPGEAIYIRDEETGDLWSPTAQPIRHEKASYVSRHGRGYSRFEHISHGIELDLLQFVPLHDPVKISRLRLRNISGRSRKLSVTTYVEWILGTLREGTGPYIVTSIDSETGAMFAQNSWNAAFAAAVAFTDLGGRQREWSGDRRDFIGRNGSLHAPAAMAAEAKLSGDVGAGLDPCGALRAPIDLAPGGAVELVFFLGEAASESEAQSLIRRYRLADLDATLRAVTDHWSDILETVQVKTPDPAMDIMLNGWLLYQTLACRFWARSAFYQASGAFGFRDQLQDGMALALVRPALTRHHLLAAAGRQFPEGDLQHWWLPPLGQGVRTRISDDRVWLAYAAAQYVDVTGDHAVLNERCPFLDGPALVGMEHDAFFQPMTSENAASLYEHCALALDQSLSLGSHGLPLMGTGDWNDGMNRVGEGGKGESVWLGWFLLATLAAFLPLAAARNDHDRVDAWQAHADRLRIALEREAWDGAWYKRGYFDDGSPLGSQDNAECRIDSIAQSWAVLSGGAAPARAKQAMASLHEHLIQPRNKLALLFTPPFDQTPLDPGYIKGYPPGIRENGGQYTHAAAWTVLALAKLGDGNRAAELFALLNPINHAATAADVERYKVEPYVVAADVYSVSPLVGRGGWTWYTGSAGWMYRAGLEGLLGFRRHGTNLILDPCIPTTWPGFEITYKFQTATYCIAVVNPQQINRGVVAASLDGADISCTPVAIPLADDGQVHHVRLTLG